MKNLYLIPIISFTLISCVDDTPKCDSEDVKRILKDISIENFNGIDIYYVYGKLYGEEIKGPYTTDEWSIVSNYLELYKEGKTENIPENVIQVLDMYKSSITVKNIRTINIDNTSKKCNCVGDITIDDSYKNKDLQYSAQLNSENEIYVEALIESIE